jgi:outer membrane biosynthesis protein TonB
MKTVHRELPAYPREMLRSRLEASVYARSEVAPDGTVTDVKALAYFEGKKRGELLPFEREAERALALWTFSPAPEGQTRVRISCMTVDFVLKG